MIDVYIVAEVRLLRDGLAKTLGESPNLRVVASVARCEELDLEPDDGTLPVLLLDVARRICDSGLRSLVAAVPELRAVVLGVEETEAEIVTYAEAGAAGYLPRDGSVDDLVQMIEEVARGELSCTPRVAAALIRRVGSLAAERPPRTESPGLTERELEVLRLVSLGLSNREIATRLYLSLATVKNHVHNLLGKLAVRTRADAAAQYALLQR
ncbi:DNA-binding NarL/FixJ family response regulator [Kibdelosporangium banguiense]|uniref:DNA-binding NarL/FixJ family response regulator n=1 Tax=Kibdelosporangium banguiense TaxID=1365924 RepID=A0ABS4TQ62_9PSEU|nr:response regulator transcription factor [Kibdelosporangium banguiense]MBP2326551.1 DNA-binding NarL/FixJ family response regulator [Kibdelosporangium banguiense]